MLGQWKSCETYLFPGGKKMNTVRALTWLLVGLFLGSACTQATHSNEEPIVEETAVIEATAVPPLPTTTHPKPHRTFTNGRTHHCPTDDPTIPAPPDHR
jgi:hypothetical protein